MGLGREVIHIQIGKCGNAVGHEFWRDLCSEHHVEYKNEEGRGFLDTINPLLEDHMEVFFNEGSGRRGSQHRWVPRAILMDTNMQDLELITQDDLGHLYRPENIVGNDEGSGNCYAKAYHTEGPDLANKCLELVRKEAERADHLQAIQFTHSVCGGTGAGLGGLMMRCLKDYLGSDGKVMMQSFAVVPSPSISDMLIEPYNATLAIHDFFESCDQVFLFDNQALSSVCQSQQGEDVPSFRDMNNIVALCMSGLTSGLRFRGPLNADLKKINMNLVPFEGVKFLVTGFAPLTPIGSKKYRKAGNVLDLVQQAVSKNNVTVSCDPLRPKDPSTETPRARFLSSFACWRGAFSSYEIDKIVAELQAPSSHFDSHFPDWIPNNISTNMCSVPHGDYGDCITYVSNNTAVHEVFHNIGKQFDTLFKRGAHTHVFVQDGIDKDLMQESRNIVEYIRMRYVHYANLDDKLLDGTPSRPGGKRQINQNAVTNETLAEIAQVLQQLDDGTMYISGKK